MWWIGLIIFGVVALIIIIVAIISSNKSDDQDYNNHQDFKSGGGIQVGGNEKVPFFAPANDKAGIRGEQLVIQNLRYFINNDEYLMVNLLLPIKNGHNTEIDCVLISHKGIFCIEIKNWVGHISGSDDDEYWHQEYDDPYMPDRDPKNPVKQNEGHCSALRRKLNYNYEIDNIVIFVGLEDNYDIDSDYVYSIRSFKDYYMDLSEKLNSSQVKSIYEMLRPYVASHKELEKHREEIRQKYN